MNIEVGFNAMLDRTEVRVTLSPAELAQLTDGHGVAQIVSRPEQPQALQVVVVPSHAEAMEQRRIRAERNHEYAKRSNIRGGGA